MPRLNAGWISLFIASMAAIVLLVPVVGYESFKEGTKNKSKYSMSPRSNAYGVNVSSDGLANADTNWTDASLALALFVTVDWFDPNKAGATLGFHIDYYPLNGLVAGNATISGAPSVPVRLLLQSATSNFAPNTIMPSLAVSEILDGDVNRYPFDVFTVDYLIYAFTSPSNTTYGTPLPLTVYAEGAVQGFKVDTIFQGLEDDGSGVQITFVIKRSPITKAFSVIIIIVMWLLSGGIFIAAMSVWFRERKVELPLIAISTGLLFALPNVRNSQPGIPNAAGTTSDMVGFFLEFVVGCGECDFFDRKFRDQEQAC
ncbi:DUF4436 domain-containing protein [Mycena sanguinolenta]|uniref:DUF4436 domain-containing protein n=1 Tax=Mycena sanguinolenta TaxID=230812 RepID=A0A8H7DE25_9AGAR|nr:DUF4436 domain-containing protein [Mycena sanguinolenta]